MGFEYPQALFLLVFLGLLFGRRQQKNRPAINFAPAHLVSEELKPGWWQLNLPRLLACAALLSLLLACANYRYGEIRQESSRESRWLMLVQDLSGSMQRSSGQRTSGGGAGETLADVAREGLQSFVDLRPPEDMIGLVAFSNSARLLAPLTLDRRILREKIDLLDSKKASRIARQMAVGGATNVSYAVWLAMSAVFMMLPEAERPTFAQLKDMRYLLAGASDHELAVPAKLQGLGLERGVAIILFTDGRIKVSQGSRGRERGLPDLLALIKLLKRIGVKLYLIAVDEQVDESVKNALSGQNGALFFMSGSVDQLTMRKVYNQINTLEKNRLLTVSETVARPTRFWFMLAALVFFTLYAVFRQLPAFVRW